MAVTPIKITTGTLTTSSTGVMQTVPSGKKYIVKNIVLSNITSSDQVVSSTFNGITFLNSFPIKANDSVFIDLSTVLESDDYIDFWSGNASAVNVTVSGVEIT